MDTLGPGVRGVCMSGELLPTNAWSFPLMRFASLADDTSWLKQNAVPSGLSITEDEENIYVDAALPGVKTEDIEISFHNGVLRVTGEMQEEEKKERKSYHKMTSSYSYQVAVPGELDLNIDPEATCNDGVLTVTFQKMKASTPKKIQIKGKTNVKAKKSDDEKLEAKSSKAAKSEPESAPDDISMVNESTVDSVVNDGETNEVSDETIGDELEEVDAEEK